MIAHLGVVVSRLFGRFMPDPFVIAVILTALTAALAVGLGDFPRGGGEGAGARCLALLDAWRGSDGLWRFLAFSMEMCLILITGHALAASGPVRALLSRLASLARGTAGGAWMVCSGACLASLINWGLGLVVGAILAREVGLALRRRGVAAHYPLLVAAGFAGFMVWHGGLSGSAPLSMTSAAGAARVLPAQTLASLSARGLGDGLPLDQTVFAGFNLVATLGLVVIIPLAACVLAPRRREDVITIDEAAPGLTEGESPAGARAETGAPTPAQRLDRGVAVAVALSLLLAAGVWRQIEARGVVGLGLGEINAAMMALGLLLHGSARAYLSAVDEAARGCGGIIVQFPLYGGILAMMSVSGLDRMIAQGLIEHASARTLPFIVFVLAGVLNMFIPSGGGQWAVQGPIALEAGERLGVDPGLMVMSVAYGDQLTNMLQPFWALPLLVITRIRARDIVGYTAMLMLVAGAWLTAVLLLA
ncbi:MAG: short-chain fatty acid transporter [Phycisphaeraceae bacterium]|nr:short-chain fatty acid transporter [Phycisphaeraceae bacterium]